MPIYPFDPKLPGQRERAKNARRTAIQHASVELFAAHDYDAVTLDDIARHAGVARRTVMSYFPTKRDLVLAGAHQAGERMVQAVNERAADESTLKTIYRWVMTEFERYSGDEAELLQRMYVRNPEINALQLSIFGDALLRCTDDLASDLGYEPDDPRIAIALSALAGVFRNFWQSFATSEFPQIHDLAFKFIESGMAGIDAALPTSFNPTSDGDIASRS